MKREITQSRTLMCAKIISCGLVFFFVWFGVNQARAAQLNIVSQTQEVGIGSQFQVDLILDTENEQINAVEGRIVFPEELLEVKEIRDGNSIVNFWIERPKAEGNQIIFSGITPGGYQDSNGFLFSAIFTAKTEGEGIIEFRNVRALKNDGLGTPANVKISSFQFNIKDLGRHYINDVRRPEIEDKEPPETFRPEITKDAELFNGQWFLVFATQDKGSGIAYYAVYESTRKRTQINTKKWVEAESPYLLKDQNLRSFIYVKAVDKAGNERIVVVEPRYPMRWYEFPPVWIIIILVIVMTLTARRIMRKFLSSKS